MLLFLPSARHTWLDYLTLKTTKHFNKDLCGLQQGPILDLLHVNFGHSEEVVLVL